MCPWGMALRALADHVNPDGKGVLFPDVDGKFVPKVKIKKAWMDHIDEQMQDTRVEGVEQCGIPADAAACRL